MLSGQTDELDWFKMQKVNENERDVDENIGACAKITACKKYNFNSS